MILDLHSIFFLLGTLEGELLKKSVEFILFILITYMVASEYTRSPRKELKYLIAAFGTLSFQTLLASSVLAHIVFGDMSPAAYTYFFEILNRSIETAAIVLLSGAFLFPLFKKEKNTLKKRIGAMLSLIGAAYLGLQLVQGYEYIVGARGPVIYWGNLIFTSINIILILSSVYMMSIKTKTRYKYRYSAIVAFLVYLVSPFLKFIAYAFYNGDSPRLFVAAHPFPIMAVILFTRVIYLKLADKAYLKKQLEHEKEVSCLKDKFVSVVSHELRTPLTSIGLYASLLRDKKLGKVTKKQKKAAGVIKEESIRLTNLVNDILDLSKMESGRMKISIGRFDVNSFVEEDIYKNLAKQKKIRITNNVPKGFSIRADPDKFKQVMINLISNSIKYTDRGGEIAVSAFRKNGRDKIIIEDTGRGIAEEELKKIFDKFYQAESYVTRDQGGVGLGLAIANEIVKMHRGEIKVSSKVGEGSRFIVILPADA